MSQKCSNHSELFSLEFAVDLTMNQVLGYFEPSVGGITVSSSLVGLPKSSCGWPEKESMSTRLKQSITSPAAACSFRYFYHLIRITMYSMDAVAMQGANVSFDECYYLDDLSMVACWLKLTNFDAHRSL